MTQGEGRTWQKAHNCKLVTGSSQTRRERVQLAFTGWSHGLSVAVA